MTGLGPGQCAISRHLASFPGFQVTGLEFTWPARTGPVKPADKPGHKVPGKPLDKPNDKPNDKPIKKPPDKHL